MKKHLLTSLSLPLLFRRRLEWSGGLGEGSVTAVLVGHVMLLRGDTLLLAVDNPTKYVLCLFLLYA